MGGNHFSFLIFPLFIITATFWDETFSMNVSNVKMPIYSNFTGRSIKPRATSGTVSGTTNNPYYTAHIFWQVAKYPAQWYTHIEAMFYMTKDSADAEGVYNRDDPVCEITVGGKTSKSTSIFDFRAGLERHNILFGENNVTHNDDGQKHVWLSATFYSGTSMGTFTVNGWALLDPFYVYTITFNGNGGKASMSSMTVKELHSYGTLPTATRTGYDFDGWYTASSGGSYVTSSSSLAVESDHTLYAHWTIGKYTISFKSNGGSSCNPITKTYGSSFSLPTTSKTGYTFNYWCSDSSLTSRYTGTTMPDYSFTLYAKWTANKYTVYFNSNGDTLSKSSMTVTYDSKYGTLATTSKTHYYLNGWYTSDGSKIISSSTMKTADDHTLYARWTAIKYEITFDTNGGKSCASITGIYGSSFSLPTTSKTGYTFNYWCSDSSLTSRYTGTTMPGDNFTLYAKWIANKYFLIIEDEDNKVIIAGMYDYGTKLLFPSTSKPGYTTTFTTDEGKVLTTVPDYDVTLYVHFDIITYIMTFGYKNGTVICSRAQTYNSTIDFPTVKEEGYTFVGWRTNESVVNSTRVPASNMRFYPVFIPNNYKIFIVFNENKKIIKEFLYGEIINLTSLENEFFNGFEVLGWYMDPEHTDKITNNSIKIPAFDINIYPYVVSNQVEIVLGAKGLSEKDVENIIKGYTNANFVIESFEEQKEIIVIIKFNDVNDANEFIEAVERGSENDNGIKKISFNFSSLDSFSQVLFAFTHWFYLIL